MPRITATPRINERYRDDLAHTMISTHPTTAGVISHAVHKAMYNLKERGFDLFAQNVSFDVKFEKE